MMKKTFQNLKTGDVIVCNRSFRTRIWNFGSFLKGDKLLVKQIYSNGSIDLTDGANQYHMTPFHTECLAHFEMGEFDKVNWYSLFTKVRAKPS